MATTASRTWSWKPDRNAAKPMKLVTAAQMRELDRQTIDDDHVPSGVLMERAGAGVAMVVASRFPKGSRIVCAVGKGNNGGDAQIAARILEKSGYRCTLCTTFDAEAFATADIIIDGLLGTGARAPLSQELSEFITRINTLNKPVIAIDIPSGLDATTGRSCGAVIHANCTVTMALPKLGLYLGTGSDHAGEVLLVDIGIRPERIAQLAISTDVMTAADVAPALQARSPLAHKGDFGHVLIVAGSSGKMGAGILAARGCFRSGAGLVTYALPETAFEKFDATLSEVMLEALPDHHSGALHPNCISRLDELLKGKSAIVLGPGIGTLPETAKVVHHLLQTVHVPMVIDADALNCLSEHPEWQALLNDRHVLTPHPGEMARLIQKTTLDVQDDRLGVARSFAERTQSILVLKGHHTLIAYNQQVAINPTGNPGMATAGMGDVLSGIIGGLLAQGLEPLDAARSAVFLHGLAADLTGDQGLLASDVANALPKAVQALQAGDVQIIPVLHPKV